LPAIAFSTLALDDLIGSDANQRYRRDRALRLALVSSTAALVIIFLSTGTMPPGNVIFDRLYQLPFGWLLREPGRFLMVVGLAYAVLAAAATQTLLNDRSLLDAWKFPRSLGVPGLFYVPTTLALSALVGFPLLTGVVVPDARPSLPSAHVKVPDYWPAMARLTDSLSIGGAVLVMPPDDFYQMPYKWGYYGNDAFVTELFKRHVLIPNGEGYSPATSEVISAVNLTAQSILSHNWRQAQALVTALNTPLILVRHDVDSAFPGRTILSSDQLGDALASSPNFVLVRKIDSLELFALRAPASDTDRNALLTTVDTATPDLRLLSLLPDANLVSTEAQAGVPRIAQAPPLEMWNTSGATVWWAPSSPNGWSYSVTDLPSNTIIRLEHSGSYPAPGGVSVAYAPGALTNKVAVSIPAQSVIANGDFTHGQWGAVGNCYQATTTGAPSLEGYVIPISAPGGLPALRLSASSDSACESQSLTWKSGSIAISLLVRHIDGTAPRVCLWEIGPSRCAPLPDLPSNAAWTRYRGSVTPDAGTTSILLYLYADGGASHRTTNDYANVSVVAVQSLPHLALLGLPDGSDAATSRLVVDHTTYSDAWQGSPGKHVLVDGMLNGWLVPSRSTAFTTSYAPSRLIQAAQWVSVLVLLATLLVATRVPLNRAWHTIGEFVQTATRTRWPGSNN
jgi:arabinofuranan 3-O-arabinosyltransferase